VNKTSRRRALEPRDRRRRRRQPDPGRALIAIGTAWWDTCGTSEPAPAPKPRGPKGFVFGDPRRPRSLAIALVVAIATFPAAWFVLLILYALGEGDTTGHAESSVALLAAVIVALGAVAASIGWIAARRSYPRDARVAMLGREGILSAAAVLAILGPGIVFGVWA
jgi:hypothetical protein